MLTDSDSRIADVGETLIDLLRINMSDLVDDVNQELQLTSPAEISENEDIRLTLFLYSVVQTPFLKNEPHTQINPNSGSVSPGETYYPPLSLDLYYMMTSFGKRTQSETETSIDSQKILGRAMRIFYDNSIVSGSVLRKSLEDSGEELRITLNTITVEDITRIWSVLPDKSYQASVSYLVTPVRIPSKRIVGGQRVVSKETDHEQMVSSNSEDK